jgi:hypothetical protein
MGTVRDLSGQTFGSWEVISFNRLQNSRAYFNCRCVCGTERAVHGGSLKKGTSKSCGCSIRKPPGESSRNNIYRAYRRGAARRSLRFDLTIEQFSELTNTECHYCGAPPAQTNKNLERYMAPYVYNGIDRVDSAAGYIMSNCVPCCGPCNMMKRNNDYDDFIARCAAITERHAVPVE